MGSSAALAQDSGGAAPPAAGASTAEQLPTVEVVQETPTQKAVRAKKKAPAVSPLSNVGSGTPSAASQSAGSQAAATAAPVTVAAPITVPSAVTNVTDAEIDREGTASIQQVLQAQVPGIILSDAAGNPLRAEVSYRGFDASPVSGRSQGMAVYQNGIRINEAFGDVVNWDVLPSNAISSLSVVSNNPSFGLNAVGGAVSISMKDGFSYQGGELDVMFGSFGRQQVGVQAGGNSGNAAFYVAAEGIEDDSFRNYSESEIKRFYGDLGLKGSFVEVHASLTAASNHFGATAAAPVELLADDWGNTFTSPQTTDLEVLMPTISATVKATDTLSFSGVGYYRRFKNRVVDGNLTEAGPCVGDEEFLCAEEGAGEHLVENGTTDPINIGSGPGGLDLDEDYLGSIERLATTSSSWGGAIEAQEKARLFGMRNLFLAGVSYDHGNSNYKTSSELGVIQPGYVVDGTGVIVSDPTENELSPRNLDAENTYWGVYLSDALDVTDELTVTVGGRYNYARIKLTDKTGLFDGLNATNTYERFNPMIGANYKLLRGLSVYGGYSESNRAPTPAELGCAEEENPCLIESFLTDDPPLEQVVGRTAEIGLRGQGTLNGGVYTWGAGLFRTLASDDILPVTLTDDGAPRIFFVNAGDTLRQGVELSATYETRSWNVYGSYAFVDATLDKCTNPGEDGLCAFLASGDRLPGIPRHRFKAGFDYWLTPKWKFGADLVAASNSPLFPNEAKEDADEEGVPSLLKGYTRVDLHTSYDVTERFQIYGLVKNLFDKRYGLYGTYFEEPAEVPVFDRPNLSDPRTISPALPFAAYGGIKIKY